MYGSSFRRVTFRPRDSRIAAREAAAIPLPREDTTPPVTNTYLVIARCSREKRIIPERSPGTQSRTGLIYIARRILVAGLSAAEMWLECCVSDNFLPVCLQVSQTIKRAQLIARWIHR